MVVGVWEDIQGGQLALQHEQDQGTVVIIGSNCTDWWVVFVMWSGNEFRKQMLGGFLACR